MKTKLLIAVPMFIGNAALDDHEERTSGTVTQSGTLGDMYPASTALELGNDQPTADPVLVGLRFKNVTIPKYADIISAYIQFTVKGTSKNTDPCNLTVQAQNSANPATFSDNAFDLSARTLAAGSIAWSVSGSTWGTVGSATADQRTSDLKSLVQPLVYNSAWVAGNAMVFFIKGVGTREVESFEGDAAKAAELVVTFSTAGTPTLATGIIELTKSTSISVYPNPFKNSFTTSVELNNFSNVAISVYDISGKLVEEKIVADAPKGVFQYTSTAQLNKGLYFVKVKTNDTQKVIKLISE
jgi:hypothetical protein